MGNSALLVVFASILSGVMIFLNIQKINTDSNVIQSQLQEEVLARELAHNGLSLALARIYGEQGDPTNDEELAFGGGTIRFSTIDRTGNQIGFKVLWSVRRCAVHDQHRVQLCHWIPLLDLC